jgi:hypothetical protein
MAPGEAWDHMFDAWENWPLAPREKTLQSRCVYAFDSVCRTAGYVTRMSGAVGGGRSCGPSLSRFDGNSKTAFR